MGSPVNQPTVKMAGFVSAPLSLLLILALRCSFCSSQGSSEEKAVTKLPQQPQGARLGFNAMLDHGGTKYDTKENRGGMENEPEARRLLRHSGFGRGQGVPRVVVRRASGGRGRGGGSTSLRPKKRSAASSTAAPFSCLLHCIAAFALALILCTN